MGCDIHATAEVRRDGQWHAVTEQIFPLDKWDQEYYKRTHGSEPFSLRNYGLFGFLAGVRNYSAVPPVSAPKGMPEDAARDTTREYEDCAGDAHSASWLTLAELLAIDYDSSVEDRRFTRQVGPRSFDGGATAEPGEGKQTTWREFLPEVFFRDLAVLQTLGAPEDVRVVFWFDN